MDKQLTAGQALNRAEEHLAAAMRLREDGDLDLSRQLVELSQAYSTYALAMVAWDGTLDVRAHVESGV